MNKIKRNFIIKISVLTVILAIIASIIFNFWLKSSYFSTFPFLLLAFPVISVITHFQLLKASKKSLGAFNIAFMLSFMIKLFAYLALAGTIISLETENKTSFVISLLLLYLIYTIFDVKAILEDMKKVNPESSEKR